MWIGCVQLSEVRNYRTLSWRPAPRLNVVSGLNAQGKTNLLEALGFIVTGRSFRTSRLAEIPRWGADATTLAGDLVRGEAQRTVRRALNRLEDGTWQSTGEAAPEWARVIAFGWQDLEIVNGGPAARRNFIDGFAGRLYPNHIATLLRFRQILARRNRLLQQRTHDAAPASRLQPWNEQLATVGMELLGRRRKAVAALQTELARVYAAPGFRLHSDIVAPYRTALGEATEPAALLAALEHRQGEEMRRRLTLVGPHRDDLAIELDGVDARAFGSRGQQRLVALALRLAEVMPVTEAAGTAPVLLLDDALSELDATVRGHVLREVQSAEQVFLTMPDTPAVEGAAIFQVSGGSVIAA